MPIYEFWCSSCQQKIDIYQQGFSNIPHSCPNCGNNKLERIFSPFSIRKTNRQVYEEIRDDKQFERAVKGNDPKAIAEFVERTGGGSEIPDECKETIGKLAKGEWPMKGNKPSESE